MHAADLGLPLFRPRNFPNFTLQRISSSLSGRFRRIILCRGVWEALKRRLHTLLHAVACEVQGQWKLAPYGP